MGLTSRICSTKKKGEEREREMRGKKRIKVLVEDMEEVEPLRAPSSREANRGGIIS